MTSDLMPLIRIAMYCLSTWMVSRGIPIPIVDMFTKDPAMIHLISDIAGQVIGAVVGLGAFIWWRLAKRFAWAT